MENLIATRYALRMLGVPLLHELWLFGDNMAVILNYSKPENTLKKKHHACAYHFIREMVSTGWLFLIHKSSKLDRADILTKALDSAVLYGKIKGWVLDFPKSAICLRGMSRYDQYLNLNSTRKLVKNDYLGKYDLS